MVAEISNKTLSSFLWVKRIVMHSIILVSPQSRGVGPRPKTAVPPLDGNFFLSHRNHEPGWWLCPHKVLSCPHVWCKGVREEHVPILKARPRRGRQLKPPGEKLVPRPHGQPQRQWVPYVQLHYCETGKGEWVVGERGQSLPHLP